MIPKWLQDSRGSQGATGFKWIPRSYWIQGDPNGLSDPGIGVESKGFQIKHLNKEIKKEGKNCREKKMTCFVQPGF